MKQFKLTLLLTVLMSMLGLQAFADWDTSKKIEVGGLYYYLDETNQQAQVTSMPSGKYTGDIMIPTTFTYNETNYSVTEIGGSAFYNCSALTSVTIPNSVTSIGTLAFSGCTSLTSVTIPNSVTSIGNSAFSGCSGLTSVIIPNSVTSIGSDAFSGCSGLTSVIIPNSVTSIGGGAFYGCSSLTSVTIPNSVTSFGYHVFSGCTGITSITVVSGNTKYDSRDNCNAIIETTSNTLVYGCMNTTIPNSVKTIGRTAFYGCSGLTSVIIPNSVTSIGTLAFSGCTSLTSVTIPNSVKIIDGSAFDGCSSLSSVIIPNSVMRLGEYAFYRCPSLTSVTCLLPTPLTISSSVFSNREKATLYVPKGSKSAYQDATTWKQFKEIVEIDVTGIKAVENEQIAGSDETGNWYTLDGRRLSGKPTKRGIYIVNGRKVIVN